MKFKDRDVLLTIEEVKEALNEYSIEATQEDVEKFVHSYKDKNILDVLNYRQIADAYKDFKEEQDESIN